MYDHKYSVHNRISGKILFHLCLIYFILFLPYNTVLARNNLFHDRKTAQIKMKCFHS